MLEFLVHYVADMKITVIAQVLAYRINMYSCDI